MRLEIILKPTHKKFLIPVNYNYPLSAVIYKVFATAGPKFADWLHTRGFSIDDGKRFKFFNFSRLFFDSMKVEEDTIIGEGFVRFYLSSPIEDTMILNFVNGLLGLKNIFIGNKSSGTNFSITKVSISPIPNFDFDMKFVMLSPTVASIKTTDGKVRYILPDKPEISASLENNLKNKYKILNNKTYHEFLSIQPDLDYIAKRGGGRNTTKLISIKEDSKDEIKIRGFMSPIRIIGSPEIIKLAYYAGIGEKNSLGFGAIEEAKKL